MQRITALSFVLFLTVAAGLKAQRFPGGFHGAPAAPPGPAPGLGMGLPPVGPIPPLGGVSPGFPSGFITPGFGPGFGGRRPGRFAGGGFPYYWGGYGYDYSMQAAPPVTNVLMLQQPPEPPPKPPEPIRSSIKEYKAQPPAEPAAPVKPVYFVIALKNGARLSASAVWVQGNVLHYVDSDDQNGEVPLTDVDRKATRESNQAQNLNLNLPPPAR